MAYSVDRGRRESLHLCKNDWEKHPIGGEARCGMHVEHVALWVCDLERAKCWWETYFDATAGDEYVNAVGFHSYFLTFPDGGARLELMWDGTQQPNEDDRPHDGYGHVAVSVGSKEEVDALTTRLVADGFRCLSGPRTTGDGYYESCVLDAEGNRVEITV